MEENLRNKLCHYYEKQLLKDTTSHDKIEFEIVFSCLDFSTDRRLKDLLHEGFSFEEVNILRQTLYNQTNDILENYSRILSSDKNDLQELESIRLGVERNVDLKCDNVFVTLQSIYQLLSSLKKYGTPQIFPAGSLCLYIEIIV